MISSTDLVNYQKVCEVSALVSPHTMTHVKEQLMI